MKKRTLLAAAVLLANCGRSAPPPDPAAARREHALMQQRLEALLPRDPAVVQALARPGDVQLAIRSELAQAVVREVARRYLDRVELNLALEKRVQETGSVEVGTPFGKMKAGDWTADVVVHRVHGLLEARTPEITIAGHNHLRVRLPVALRQAEGSATVRFRWDARALAGVVCRDFEVSRTIRGRLSGEDYTLEGAVRLAAGPHSVRAEPSFARSPFRLRVDLLPESWREVRAAVDEQDKLLRCGLAIDPQEVLARLSTLLRNGFELRLPRGLFRAADLPGSVGGSVELAGRPVEVTLASEGLQVSAEAVWYGASVRSRAAAAAPPTP